MSANPNKVNFTIGSATVLTYKNLKSEMGYALGEFIDNSLQSYIDNKEELHASRVNYKPYVRIEIDNKKRILTIEDNCGGISDEDATRAFTVGHANPNKKGIGTYGMGMKVSACWFSDNWRVNTKCLKESYAKTYKVDVQKIARGTSEMEPKIQENYDGTSFTHIIIEDVFVNRNFDNRSMQSIENHLNDQYMVFLKNNLMEISFNGIPLKYSGPNIRVAPKYQDYEENTGKYIENSKKLEWKTSFDFDLGNGYKASGEAYLLAKGKTSKQKGFGIFWKNRNITGNSIRPWAPTYGDYTDKKDQTELGIFAGKNSAYNQRLEGNIYLNDKFKVTSTKDDILWEEDHEEKLIKALYSHLRSCKLDNHPDEGPFNLRDQAMKQIYNPKNKQVNPLPPPGPDSPPKPLPPKDPPTGGPKKPEPKPPKDSSDVFKYEGDDGHIFKLHIDYVETLNDDLFQRVEGPTEKEGETLIGITINSGHRFLTTKLLSGDELVQEQAVYKLIKFLVLVECQLMNEHKDGKFHFFNREFNKLLNYDL